MGVFAMNFLHGETLVFRGGEILAAELTDRKPVIANYKDESGQIRSYALITVKLLPGRTISTEDYSLGVLGGKYPCIAVREEDGEFDAAHWMWRAISPKKKYGLLFALEVPQQTIPAALVCNAPGKWQKTELELKNLRSGAFSGSSAIPEKGSFRKHP